MLNPDELVHNSFSNPFYFDDSDRLHDAVFALSHEPEYRSVENAIENVIDERETLSWLEVRAIGMATKKDFKVVAREVKSYGFSIFERAKVNNCRFFNSNPHDRWFGAGSEKCHGGSGGSSIVGLYNVALGDSKNGD